MFELWFTIGDILDVIENEEEKNSSNPVGDYEIAQFINDQTIVIKYPKGKVLAFSCV